MREKIEPVVILRSWKLAGCSYIHPATKLSCPLVGLKQGPSSLAGAAKDVAHAQVARHGSPVAGLTEIHPCCSNRKKKEGNCPGTDQK